MRKRIVLLIKKIKIKIKNSPLICIPILLFIVRFFSYLNMNSIIFKGINNSKHVEIQYTFSTKIRKYEYNYVKYIVNSYDKFFFLYS